MAVTLLKMKPVYGISINGEIIGYIKNKNGFEKTIYETFNDNEETNIAFADLKVDTKYEFKLIERKVETCEEEAITALAKNADITYFQYAILANGEEIENFLSEEQANEVLEKIKGKVENDVELSVSRVGNRRGHEHLRRHHPSRQILSRRKQGHTDQAHQVRRHDRLVLPVGKQRHSGLVTCQPHRRGHRADEGVYERQHPRVHLKAREPARAPQGRGIV